MNKYIYVMLFMCICFVSAKAQRMVTGQKGWELTVGILSGKYPRSNYYLNSGITRYGKHGNYFLWNFEYYRQHTNYRNWRIPLETYTTEAGYSLQLLGNYRKYMTLNAGLTALAGYENINKGDSLLPNGATILDKSGWIYGAAGRLSFETYVHDRLTLLLQGKVKLLWNTSRESFRPSVGIGFRYNF